MDFILRIPPLHQALLGEKLTLEHEDLAVVLIKKHFRSVELIDKRALFALVSLLAATPSRRPAERAVFASRLVKQTEFTFECLARREQEEALERVRKVGEAVDIFQRKEPTFFRIKVIPPAPRASRTATS